MAQQICFCYNGEWSSWSKIYEQSFRYEDGSGFLLKNTGGKESFVFRITNYIPPTKTQKKIHNKSGLWYEYSGYVEYYVSDEYPTAQDIARQNELVIPDARRDKTPRVKRSTSAIIKVAPYKKNPYCFNIWFDGIGIGFSAYGMKYGNDELK